MSVVLNSFCSLYGLKKCAVYFRVNDEDVRLMLWDTAGQEEFDAITKAYYRGENTMFVVWQFVCTSLKYFPIFVLTMLVIPCLCTACLVCLFQFFNVFPLHAKSLS